MKIFLIILIISTLIFYITIHSNIGKNTKIEENRYKNLTYYKNGFFIAPKPINYYFEKINKNKITIILKFILKSKNAPKSTIPTIKPNFNNKPQDFAIYWLGHSSAILELDGKRIMIDPVFKNASPIPFTVKRYVKSVVGIKDLPKIDYILITHNHYDHLEKNTIKSIKNGHFIVPLGVSSILRGWGIDKNRITELAWNENFTQNNLSIISLPSIHFSGRGLNDANRSLWNTFVIKSKNKNIFWSGDTGYDENLVNIYKKYGPFDISAIEIDAWNEAWPDIHMFPDNVITLAKNINTNYILPIHWGVFDLAMHPWKESIELIFNKSKDHNLNILTPKIGEKIDENNLPNTNWWKEIN